MKIDRTNYEIWFIDWLDGNLSKSQTEILNKFLIENPDLKEEFNELGSFIVKPSVTQFPNKEQLKKSPGELSQSQFEYLCTAYLENDLTGNQKKELEEIIGSDPEKKRTFELIQKTRLKPPAVVFRQKYLLKRRTTVQKIIKLSLIGLSAAAAITIIIMTYIFIPRNPSATVNTTAQLANTPEKAGNSPSRTDTNNILANRGSIPSAGGRHSRNSTISKDKLVTNKPAFATLSSQDSLKPGSRITEIAPARVIFRSTVNPGKISVSNTLVASNSKLSAPSDENGRSNIGRFIAKTFREKILREKTTLDTPLKGYEIAEAGVTGLNKLFGWEMALDKRNDQNGELKSVYFSSRILKFNAPVKKTQALP